MVQSEGGREQKSKVVKVGKGKYTHSGKLGCQVFLAAEWVLAVVDGVTQFLQHHVQRGVLGQFHHEHTCLNANVA